MKNIFEYLKENKIEYKIVKYGGNGVYIDIPIIEAISITLEASNPIIDDLSKKVKRNTTIKNIGCGYSYGFYNIVLVNEKKYHAMIEKDKADREKIELFWEIYHEQGKQAAETYYRKNTEL